MRTRGNDTNLYTFPHEVVTSRAAKLKIEATRPPAQTRSNRHTLIRTANHIENKSASIDNGTERHRTIEKKELPDSQVAVIVKGFADLLGNRFVNLHDGRLVPAAVTIVGRAEDCADSLRYKERCDRNSRHQQQTATATERATATATADGRQQQQTADSRQQTAMRWRGRAVSDMIQSGRYSSIFVRIREHFPYHLFAFAQNNQGAT